MEQAEDPRKSRHRRGRRQKHLRKEARHPATGSAEFLVLAPDAEQGEEPGRSSPFLYPFRR